MLFFYRMYDDIHTQLAKMSFDEIVDLTDDVFLTI